MSPEERLKADKTRDSRLRLIFNITAEEYDKILSYQQGVCAITRQPSSTLYIDHRHSSGLVSGLLSFKVNKGLAYFDDDPVLLERAAEYLRNPPAVAALGECVYGVIGRVTNKAKTKKGKNNRFYGPDHTETPQPRAAITELKTKVRTRARKSKENTTV